MLANFVIFAGLSTAICFAGVQLQRSADTIAMRFGLQRAFAGVLLLSAATSLPETAVVISASRAGDATLAVYTLMGAVMTQLSLLVIADLMACRREPITHLTPQFLLLFEGVGVVMLLALTIAGMAAGPIVVFRSIDMWIVFILVAYITIIYSAYRLQSYPRWEPAGPSSIIQQQMSNEPRCIDETSGVAQEHIRFSQWKLSSVVTLFAVSAVIILVSGWTATHVAEVLSVQTGLGASFIGVTLLAFATSTPELASVISSSREGAYSLAFSNIFGTAMYKVFLLVIAEIFFTSGIVFQGVHKSAIFAAAIGLLITCVYIWGLLEHENRTVLRLGWDSAIVLFLYLGGYYILYLIR